MVEAHRAPQFCKVIIFTGHIAHRAPDEMEGGRARVVRILPGPAVSGQGGQVLHLGQRAVRSHFDPDALVGICSGREQLPPVLLPDGLPQLGEGLALGQYRDQGHAAGPGRLPGPGVGMSCAGERGQRAVGVLLCLHQGDLSLVHLRLGVHDVKNTLSSGQGGEQGGHLLGDLVQGLAHLFRVIQVNDQTAQVKALEDRQQSAKGRGEGIADVHQVAGDGHDHNRVEIRLLSGVPVGGVQRAEVSLGLLLVGKGLDHLQTLDDLLDLAVHVAQGALLGAVEFPAASAQGLEQNDGDSQQKGGDQKELPVDEEHHAHQAGKHQHTGAQGDHALLQGHLHIVRVVGEAAHQFPVGMLVKVAQRQGLELVEQVLAQAVDPALGQADHHGGLPIGGGAACHIDHHQDQYGLSQAGKVGAGGPDKVVDDGAHHV